MSTPALFRPIQIQTHIVYAWLTTNNPPSIPNFVFCLTPAPKPIRQGKRLSPMGHFVTLTEAKCQPIAELEESELHPYIYALTQELLDLRYPMFDQQGEPLFAVETHKGSDYGNNPNPIQCKTCHRPATNMNGYCSVCQPKSPIQSPTPTTTHYLTNQPDLLSQPPHPAFLLALMAQVQRRLHAAEMNRKRVERHRNSESKYIQETCSKCHTRMSPPIACPFSDCPLKD